jgi:hypothetical protein
MSVNASYLGGWDHQENGDSRPVWINGSQDPISKITRAKWTGDAVECLLCKYDVLSSNPNTTEKNKETQTHKILDRQNLTLKFSINHANAYSK